MGGLKGLCFFKAKTGGRNNQGRITSFHRGGGAKRLQRKIDLKRNTASMGVVESVEYDPNRSARIALVRWIGDMQFPLKKEPKEARKPAPVRKAVELATANLRGTFSFSSMPGMRIVDEHQRSKTHPKDVFYSAFSSPNPAPLPLPRIATAGADPAFVAMRIAGNASSGSGVCEVRKCIPKDSVFWSHRIKPKKALSWNSCKQRETFGLVPPNPTAPPPKTLYWVGSK